MKRLSLTLLLVPALASTLFAGSYRVLEWDDTSVTVEFLTGDPVILPLERDTERPLSRIDLPGFASPARDGLPRLPVRRYLFEVPSPEVRLQVLESRIVPLEGVLPEVFLRDGGSIADQRHLLEQGGLDLRREFVTLAQPGVHRRRHIAFMDLFPIILDRESGNLLQARRLVVRLTFPKAAGTADKPHREGPVDHLVVNRRQAAEWRTRPDKTAPAQRTPFEFARSSNWVRVEVPERGVYMITYGDLMDAGVDPRGIDRTKLRLFSGGPIGQPDSVTQGGSFENGYHLREHAITFRPSSFWDGDSILFYGVGVTGWMNDIDPGRPETERYEHLYENENVYWLTWGEDFTGQPKRMTSRGATPNPSATIEVTSYEERLHIEDDVLYDPVFTGDRWYWRLLLEGSTSSFTHSFFLDRLASSNGIVRAIGYGPFQAGQNNSNSAVFSVNGTEVGSLEWTVEPYYRPSAMKIFEQPVANLISGMNSFHIELDYTLYNNKDEQMYVQWYEVLYDRMLTAVSGVIDFHGPAASGVARYTVDGFPAGQIVLFDVTDHDEPVILDGFQRNGGELVFGDGLAGADRHYTAVSLSQIARPALSDSRSVPSLRDETPPPHMVIIYNELFHDAATELLDHRSANLPYAESPVVRAVDVEDVYNNFSGGLKDPLAIRNYLKFLYDNFTEAGDPTLRYALLIGNGTYDPRDILGKGSDLLPFYFNVFYTGEGEGIEDDDFLVKLDPYEVVDLNHDGIPDTIPDHIPDVAIGRMPVLTGREASAWVDRIIHYEGKYEFGSWLDKIILVADDEFSSGRDIDFYFQTDAEEIASLYGPLPVYIDRKKVYLHHYPFVGDWKPGARDDLLEEWSKGALIINYAGHGSPQQMADERVMLNSDIYSLTNGPRRPFFMVFSCSVGDLESPYQRSMGQNLVTFDGGGAIGAFCAVAPTLGYPNDDLNVSVFENLFISKDSTGTEPVGYAVQLAKYATYRWERNNSKFALLCDPALALAVPGYIVEHDIAPIDTMLKGYRYRIEGAVKLGGQIHTGFNGSAEIIVQEAEQRIDEWVVRDGNDWHVRYTLPGNVLFKGNVDVNAGVFGIDFVVPNRCRTGSTARVRTYVTAGRSDGVGACDTLVIQAADSLPDNDGTPAIRMYFSGQATRVKPGARLIAEISDPDGIAILGADPQSSIFFEFDNSGYPVFVTDYFEYEYASFTTGRIEYPLHSGFSPGEHTVVLRAFDNLGASSSDTLSFEIVEENLYSVSDVFNFPNPFTESTNFVFQLSSEADITLKVFNLSGVEVWNTEAVGDEGFNSIYWDGRDRTGDKLANGTYLYILKVNFKESYNREETIEGRVVLLK